MMTDKPDHWFSFGLGTCAGIIVGLITASVLDARPAKPAPAVACQVALETAPDTLGLLIADPPAPCFPYWSAKLRATAEPE